MVTIPILLLGDTPLCPIVAINGMVWLYLVSDNEPLFIVPRAQSLIPLTDSVARKHLKDISSHLGLSKSLTFHDFRRAGASWAFQNGVPLEDIMKHGAQTPYGHTCPPPLLLNPLFPEYSRLVYIPNFILGAWVSLLHINNHILMLKFRFIITTYMVHDL